MLLVNSHQTYCISATTTKKTHNKTPALSQPFSEGVVKVLAGTPTEGSMQLSRIPAPSYGRIQVLNVCVWHNDKAVDQLLWIRWQVLNRTHPGCCSRWTQWCKSLHLRVTCLVKVRLVSCKCCEGNKTVWMLSHGSAQLLCMSVWKERNEKSETKGKELNAERNGRGYFKHREPPSNQSHDFCLSKGLSHTAGASEAQWGCNRVNKWMCSVWDWLCTVD